MTPLKKGLEMAKSHSAKYNGSLQLKEEYSMTFSEYFGQKRENRPNKSSKKVKRSFNFATFATL